MVEMSRRDFVRTGTVGALVLTVPAAELLSAPASAVRSHVPQLLASPARLPDLVAFQSCVNSAFLIDTGVVSRRVHLVEAVARPVRSRRPGSGDSFSLLFRGRSSSRLASAVYTVRHPTLGRMALFLGPVGQGLDYEAVVNQWRPSWGRSAGKELGHV
ncbi:MAG: hypothetical protein ABR549_03330 [Mycobacteriales bacterium]